MNLSKKLIVLACVFALPSFAPAVETPPPLVHLPAQLSGEEPKIRIENLSPNQVYRFDALRGVRAIPDPKKALLSSASFRSDSKGQIDLSKAVPLNGYGSFKGIDPWGLLWSMEQVDLQKLRARTDLNPTLLDEALKDLTLDQIKIIVRDESKIAQIAQLEYRSLIAGGREIPIDAEQEQFKGVLYLPPKSDVSKKLPGIVLWHGSDGVMPTQIAQYYASRGYAALALQYFTFDKNQAKPYLTDHIRRTPIEVAERAIDWLAKQSEVDAKKIAVYGGSRGGELALLVGRHFGKKVAAVIAHRPAQYAYGSKAEVQNLEEVSSWTYRGQDIPYVSILSSACAPIYIDELTDLEGKRTQIPVDEENRGIEAYRFRDGFLRLEKNHETCGRQAALAQGQIETSKIPVPLMLTAGTDDEMWPAEASVVAIQKERRKAGFTKDKVLIHPGSGHVGGIPGNARVPTWSLMPFSYKPSVKQSIWVYGGSPKANHDASLLFAKASLVFLKRTLNAQ